MGLRADTFVLFTQLLKPIPKIRRRHAYVSFKKLSESGLIGKVKFIRYLLG